MEHWSNRSTTELYRTEGFGRFLRIRVLCLLENPFDICRAQWECQEYANSKEIPLGMNQLEFDMKHHFEKNVWMYRIWIINEIRIFLKRWYFSFFIKCDKIWWTYGEVLQTVVSITKNTSVHIFSREFELPDRKNVSLYFLIRIHSVRLDRIFFEFWILNPLIVATAVFRQSN